MKTQSSKKYIIDTDPGHDDAMALMLAIKAGLNVVAITTVCGNSSIENTTRNAQYIMDLLGRKDIPIYSGAQKPLGRDLIQAVVHGVSGLEGIDPDNEPIITNNAVEKILEILGSEDDVSIITLWPLTNIAEAIQQNPQIMMRAKEIIIMWGAIRVPGNNNRVAEFNIFVDPEAADEVFRFPIPKTIVPLDACNDIPMYMSDFEQIQWNLREPLLRMVAPYIRNINQDEWGKQAALMYDPLTVYFALRPENCITQELDVLVEIKWELTRGMTVADFRRKKTTINPIQVVTSIQADAFVRDFIETLNQ